MAEVVIVMGYNGAGKTTYALENFPTHHRLNRDLLGGKLKDLPIALDKALKDGVQNVVLDNTYADVESRSGIIACAKEHKIPVRCIWIDTSLEDAQFNACQRQIEKHGRLLTVEEMKKTKDPNMFPPIAIFSYRKRFQEPTKAEGFAEVVRIPFVRKEKPYTNVALILDYDDTLRSTGTGKFPRSLEEIKILPGRKEKLQEYKDKGYLLLGVSNQSGIFKKEITEAQAIQFFKYTNELLGHDIDFTYCPHQAGGPTGVSCYCRKPHVGNMVLLIEKYKLNRHECIFVGDQKTDESCAERAGMKFFYAKDFFND
jgi:HAD superfamily hydrolase (TIGR01662 family)